jgi:hypothetical protein
VVSCHSGYMVRRSKQTRVIAVLERNDLDMTPELTVDSLSCALLSMMPYSRHDKLPGPMLG